MVNTNALVLIAGVAWATFVIWLSGRNLTRAQRQALVWTAALVSFALLQVFLVNSLRHN